MRKKYSVLHCSALFCNFQENSSSEMRTAYGHVCAIVKTWQAGLCKLYCLNLLHDIMFNFHLEGFSVNTGFSYSL
jgi:hypothetical protein